MVAQADENDEQCQYQERSQDECNKENISGFW
jgi:hypothetical protein